MSVIPRDYPEEWHLELPAIARRSLTPMSQIAKDFGFSDVVIRRWIAKADVEDGLRLAAAARWSMRRCRKRRIVIACCRWAVLDSVERRCIWYGALTQKGVSSRARVSVRGDPSFTDRVCVGTPCQKCYTGRADQGECPRFG